MLICPPAGGACRSSFVLVGLMTFSACTAQYRPPASVTGVPNKTSDYRDFTAAVAADGAGNYSEALRLYRKIDANDAVATDNIVLINRSEARERIGEHYEKGLGVAEDYSAAASWYQEANYSIRARIRLGYLYAYGLGVPQDRIKARELFCARSAKEVAEDRANGRTPYCANLVEATAIDLNLLPKSADDWTPAITGAVNAKIAEQRKAEARKQAIAEQRRQQEEAAAREAEARKQAQREKEEAAALERWYREHPQTATPPQQGAGYSGNKDKCGVLDYAFAPKNMIGGMYLGNGCN